MRYLNGLFCIIMILFVIMECNDPDYAYWLVTYGVPAFWTGVVALWPAVCSCPSLWTKRSEKIRRQTLGQQ